MGPYRDYTVLYLDYQITRVPVPSSELAPPAPSPPSECVPPLEPRGGGQHSLAVEGAGGANLDDWRESLALCLLCVWSHTYLLCMRMEIQSKKGAYKFAYTQNARPVLI